MRHTLLLAITLLFALPAVFAQTKAGKTDTTKHATFYTCPMHADVVSHQPGKCPTCGMELNASQKEQMKAEVAKVYTCPMHPAIALNKDGKCPECGKALVEKKLH